MMTEQPAREAQLLTSEKSIQTDELYVEVKQLYACFKTHGVPGGWGL